MSRKGVAQPAPLAFIAFSFLRRDMRRGRKYVAERNVVSRAFVNRI